MVAAFAALVSVLTTLIVSIVLSPPHTDRGRRGPPGRDGTDGVDAIGAQGNQGPTSRPGATGTQGTQGIGTQGTQGRDGVQGPPGSAGEGGNVISAAIAFTTDNALLRTDMATGSFSVQESTLTIDDQGNMGGINILTANQVNFQDLVGGEYVGFRAPDVVSASHVLSLPATVPTGNQVLRTNATTPTDLEWVTLAGSVAPVASEKIYVTKFGSDTNGDGSFVNPYATLAMAVSVANSQASATTNPMAILISPGIYVEDNSAGPITITASGISIVGQSQTAVSIRPLVLSNDLVATSSGVRFMNLTLDANSASSTASAISLAGSFNSSNFNNMNIRNFAQGIVCGGINGTYLFDTCILRSNGIALNIDSSTAVCNNCTITGSLTSTPANTGIVATGASSILSFAGGICANCLVGFDFRNGNRSSVQGTLFKGNSIAVQATTAAQCILEACVFEPSLNAVSTQDVVVSEASTTVNIAACAFNARNAVGTSTALQVTTEGTAFLVGGSITFYTTALAVGTATDTSTTELHASSVFIRNCTNDAVQQGTSTLQINAASLASVRIHIDDPTNVQLAYFDPEESNTLKIGSLTDMDVTLLEPAIATTNSPELVYRSNLYSTQAIGFFNPKPNSPSSWFVHATGHDATLVAMTTDRDRQSLLRLVSDTADGLRGWDMIKEASMAALAFNYQNTDLVGQPLIVAYSVLQLDGVNNQVHLPTSQLVFGADTNLYRNAVASLKTDGNFTIGGLLANRVVTTDGFSQLTSSSITTSDLEFLAGVTSPVQPQLDDKVSKTGDSMSGALTMLTQNEIHFQDSAGSGLFVGLRAPAALATSYTLTFPSTAPLGDQILRTSPTFPNTFEWVTPAGSVIPLSNRRIYVTKYGNDALGNGSFTAPFASLSQAVFLANTLSTTLNPLVILVAAGLYLENNTGSPITVTAGGISVVGESSTAVIFRPTSVTNNLLVASTTIQILNVTLDSNSSVATGIGIALSAGSYSTLFNVRVSRFGIGVQCAGSGNYLINSCVLSGNGTGLNISNTLVECDNTTIQGTPTLSALPARIGFAITGTGSTVMITGGACILCETALNVTSGANVHTTGVLFRFNKYDLVQTSGGKTVVSACSFTLPSSASDIDIQVSGVGSRAAILGCEFNGLNGAGLPLGTGILVSDNALVEVSGGSMKSYTLGMQVGTIADTATTVLSTSSITLRDCVTDIVQLGSSTLIFNSGGLASSKFSIADGTNVQLAYFDFDNDNAFSIGSATDVETILLQTAIGGTNTPRLLYRPSLYSTRAIGLINPEPTTATTFFVESIGNDAHFTAITTDRTKVAQLSLISDVVGDLRGWNVTKKGSVAAELEFSYRNTDPAGQALVAEYTLLQLNGVNNQVHLPALATQLVFGGDANLYRSASNVLQTDGDWIIGGLTPNRVVTTNSSNTLVSSAVTDTELASLVGATSLLQAQLDAKVAKAGDVMTGALTLPAGSPANPSLLFTGSNSGTGLSTNGADTLSFSTTGVQRLHISSSGTVAIDAFVLAGVVHNDSSGGLSTSLIVNSDIAANAAISDGKLATIATAGKVANSATTATSLNVPGTIVLRDPGGIFDAGSIAANLIGNVTGNASGNVLKIGDVMTGSLTLPAGSVGAPSLRFTGSSNTGLGAPSSNVLEFDTNGAARMTIDSLGVVTISNLAAVGLLHSNGLGALSTSLLVNADITDATITNSKLATVSSANNAGFIVVRDGTGRFATSQITISDPVLNATDVATKQYVDTAISLGLVVHEPARAASTTNVAITGLFVVDGVTLVDNDRVLLVDQTDAKENGLWEAHAGAWTRPADFANGMAAGRAYVLVLEGTVHSGASWLCATPAAVIGTDPIFFEQFTVPGQGTDAANVGTGAGQVFRDKTGTTLNFKTLAAGPHMVITNNADDITFSTDATSANVVSTLVQRDASGNFAATSITASLTGSASNNVLKAGDSMTGTLNMLTQNEIRFQDGAGGEYVGLHAPLVIPTSYTVALPSAVPVGHQILRASLATPTDLEWFTQASSQVPAIARTVFVTVAGSDTTGDGSFGAPFASISQAVSTANTISSAANPVAIVIGAGAFVEDNVGGPIAITASGISLIGTSTLVIPTTFTNDLFLVSGAVGQQVQFGRLTLNASSGVSTASAIALAGTSTMLGLVQVTFVGFNVGVAAAGTNCSASLETCVFLLNNTALTSNNATLFCRGCTILGSQNPAVPAGIGISASGAASIVVFLVGTIQNCTTGILVSNGCTLSINSSVLRNNTSGVVLTTAATALLIGVSFELSRPSGVSVQLQDAGTVIECAACVFRGTNAAGVPQGTALSITDGAHATLNGGEITNYVIGIAIGDSNDTSSTMLTMSSLALFNNVTADLVQNGTATVIYNSGTASSSKFSFNDTTNVTLAYFDQDDDNALHIGHFSPTTDLTLVNASIGSGSNPQLQYKFALYGTRAMGYENPTATPSTFYALGSVDTGLAAITTDRAFFSRLRLVSDTGTPLGTDLALRGWDISKLASTAKLAFAYQNTDAVGQALISLYTVLQLDGVANQVQLPTAGTHLVFGGDTNLFRSAANLLQTDDDLVIGGLTANRALATNATKQLVSTSTTLAELQFVSGLSSALQPQLDAKIARVGDTMVGTLTLASGSAANPSLQFTGSVNTGLSAEIANTLSFSTGGLQRFRISSAGTLIVNAFTVSGVIHNDAGGNLSTSLIVDADVSATAAIVDSKLATITSAGKVANSATTATSANVANTIVMRDPSGNFAANVITANSFNGTVTGASSLNVLKSGDTMTGILTHPAGSAANPSIQFTGSTNTGFSAQIPNTLSFATAGQERMAISGTGIIRVNGFTTAGVVHNDASGALSTALVTNADVDPGAAIADTKLATISTAGKVSNSATTATSSNTANAIVARDGSGNFSANLVTATLSGAASANVLKAGDTMTGTLTLAAGSAANPSLQFTGSTNTGLSAAVPNTLSFATSGVQRMAISSAGTVTVSAFTTPGIVHNNLSGNLSSSLVVNADVDPAANISDTKLATISTAGKVSNSATTATTASTANTIVLRDAAGNISSSVVQTVQPFAATANGQAVSANAGTTVLILTHTANRTGLTVTFPPNPSTGQLFTIMLGTVFTITLVNVAGAGGAAIVNGITDLNPVGTNAGVSITYLYFAGNNSWCRFSSGANFS